MEVGPAWEAQTGEHEYEYDDIYQLTEADVFGVGPNYLFECQLVTLRIVAKYSLRGVFGCQKTLLRGLSYLKKPYFPLFPPEPTIPTAG